MEFTPDDERILDALGITEHRVEQGDWLSIFLRGGAHPAAGFGGYPRYEDLVAAVDLVIALGDDTTAVQGKALLAVAICSGALPHVLTPAYELPFITFGGGARYREDDERAGRLGLWRAQIARLEPDTQNAIAAIAFWRDRLNDPDTREIAFEALGGVDL